jgi:hypothetical protein
MLTTASGQVGFFDDQRAPAAPGDRLGGGRLRDPQQDGQAVAPQPIDHGRHPIRPGLSGCEGRVAADPAERRGRREPVHATDDLATILETLAPGDRVSVRVRRADGSQATLQVRLGEWRG